MRHSFVKGIQFNGVAIQADDGDEISIRADVISVEQAVVNLEIENSLYNFEGELETVSLTVGKAHELAMALLSVAEAIEFVSTPAASLDRTVDLSGRRLKVAQ